MSNKARKAVGVLFDMDNFVLSVMDNMYWLSMGVPDGEFDEVDRHAAEVNFADHDWLIVDDDKFDTEAFKDLIEAFENATDDTDDYDQAERKAIIDEANEILSMNESWDEDEFETIERYYIYDENDNCVSDSYVYIDKAISDAETANYPTIKIHKYFRDENDKLQPDGDPEIIWAAGEYVTESYDKDGNHEKCDECGALLNDAGECPRCIHGEEDLDESILTEDTLVEGPFDRLNKKMDKIDKKVNSKVDKLANPKNVAKILYSTYADQGNNYFIGDKWLTAKDVASDLKAAIQTLGTYENALTAIPQSKIDPNVVTFIDAVVRNKDGYIIRRGLELIKPNTIPFNPVRRDLMQIKDGFKASDIIGQRAEATADSASEDIDTAADQSSIDSREANINPVATDAEEISKPDWITNDAIKAAITLRAKRKDGNATYFDKEGNRIDYRNITVDNIDNIFTDKEGKEPFMKALEEVKAGLAKRKAAAIKSAALFGESYDDSLEYDPIDSDYPLDEGLNKDEFEELMNLAKEIGIKDGKDAMTFAKNEIAAGENILDALRRYRDDLGDDFELKENAELSPESLTESLDEEDIDISWFNR